MKRAHAGHRSAGHDRGNRSNQHQDHGTRLRPLGREQDQHHKADRRGEQRAAGQGEEKDPERRERALEFQRVVDKLFSLGGFRGEDDDSPVRLARRFRELAGFDENEMDDLAEIAREAKVDAERMREKLVAEAAG